MGSLVRRPPGSTPPRALVRGGKRSLGSAQREKTATHANAWQKTLTKRPSERENRHAHWDSRLPVSREPLSLTSSEFANELTQDTILSPIISRASQINIAGDRSNRCRYALR
ncbi:hypothetical protein BHAP_0656 [Bifidobacterium hapali]|uniref:Uncharacterized protein n=1 Tax=Bifidobacterium hapali TaxID=1630172 RepID=A0A261G1X0_9BIFI|nr:hypothetical protein BHAP_0656 [Bifidobacterium hapali]